MRRVVAFCDADSSALYGRQSTDRSEGSWEDSSDSASSCEGDISASGLGRMDSTDGVFMVPASRHRTSAVASSAMPSAAGSVDDKSDFENHLYSVFMQALSRRQSVESQEETENAKWNDYDDDEDSEDHHSALFPEQTRAMQHTAEEAIEHSSADCLKRLDVIRALTKAGGEAQPVYGQIVEGQHCTVAKRVGLCADILLSGLTDAVVHFVLRFSGVLF
eukprot:GHVS01051084.1.p2 GENE.GHVS01051084.1~~GHVS01051084.1.p2  ORF type:complete len:219 (+),score=38.00 GHVS01051084.1:599-1255(+)